MSSRGRVLGIDVGTSFTSAATVIDGQVQLVLDSGDPRLPTLFYVPRMGDVIVGAEARRRGHGDPGGLVRGVKRMLGLAATDPAAQQVEHAVGHRLIPSPSGSVTVRVGQVDLAPTQLVAAMLRHVRRLADQRFGGEHTRALFTVPADASPTFVQALARAAELAGIHPLRFVAEPIAGVLAAATDPTGERTIVVLDFGGGTFDATLVHQRERRFRPLVVSGDPFLGGDDYDDALADAIDGQVFRTDRVSLRRDVVAWNSLVMRCESAKRQLATVNEARVLVREAYVARGRHTDVDYLVDRAWAARRWDPLTERALDVTRAMLARAGVHPADVGTVALIGGTMHLPLVSQRFAALFGRRLTAHPDAHLAVVKGAAFAAAALTAEVDPARPELVG